MDIRRIAYGASIALALSITGCGVTKVKGKSVKGDQIDRVKASRTSDYSRLSNRELIAELDQLRQEHDRLVQSNAILQDELAWAHEDFQLVERQFAVFEKQLMSEAGKAYAVSAAAEARIRYGRIVQEKSVSKSDSTLAHAYGLIETADRLIREQNYTAALFFAERGDHMMSSAERRARLNSLPTSLLVTSDSANLRRGPGQDQDVIERLGRGTSLLCLDESAGWYRVSTPAGSEGWVHSSVVH